MHPITMNIWLLISPLSFSDWNCTRNIASNVPCFRERFSIKVEEAIARLSLYESPTSSKWREKEQKFCQAKAEVWLRYSRRIAIKIALAMKQQNLSRQDLADRLGCSPQYVSRLLKGEENLSLETICKLVEALNISILQYEFA